MGATVGADGGTDDPLYSEGSYVVGADVGTIGEEPGPVEEDAPLDTLVSLTD